MFGALIIAYLFLGGAGAGSLTVLSLFELIGTTRLVRQKGIHRTHGFPKEFYARCWPLCLATLIFGALCLLLDLGRIDRALNLFLSPVASVMAVGAYTLLIAIICAAIFTLRSVLDSLSLARRFTQILGVVGIVAGIITAVYTGILLGSLTSVLFWNSALLPALFLLSSVSTGIACILLGISFVNVRKPVFGFIRRLIRVDMFIIAFEMLFLGVYLVSAYLDPTTESTARVFLTGDLSLIFWIGLLGCGLVLPLILEVCISENNYPKQILWVALFVLVGGLILRFCIVEAATYDVSQTPEMVYRFVT